MDTIEADLEAIEKKYSFSDIQQSDLPNFMKLQLPEINKEFDAFDLPTIDNSKTTTDVFNHMIQNFYLLTNMYRKTLKQSNNFKNENLMHSENIGWSIVEDYKTQINDNKSTISQLNNKLRELTYHYASLENENKRLKNEIKLIYKSHQSDINIYMHKIKKLDADNESLKERCCGNIGKYKSQDDVTISMLNGYKSNEDVYKETIKKLQESNQQLLEELVNLKY